MVRPINLKCSSAMQEGSNSFMSKVFFLSTTVYLKKFQTNRNVLKTVHQQIPYSFHLDSPIFNTLCQIIAPIVNIHYQIDTQTHFICFFWLSHLQVSWYFTPKYFSLHLLRTRAFCHAPTMPLSHLRNNMI